MSKLERCIVHLGRRRNVVTQMITASLRRKPLPSLQSKITATIASFNVKPDGNLKARFWENFGIPMAARVRRHKCSGSVITTDKRVYHVQKPTPAYRPRVDMDESSRERHFRKLDHRPHSPGIVTAQAIEKGHDTVTARTLLIRQGTRVIGSYDSVVAYGQSRALVVWQRIILPDGSSIRIDNVPASDTEG